MEYGGIIFKRKDENSDIWKVCIPECIKKDLINFTHLKYGHLGGHKIFNILKEYCIFKNMERNVKEQLKKCILCQKSKHGNVRQEGRQMNIISQNVLDLVSIDLIGPLPKGRGNVQYILTIVDVFSKFVKLYAIKKPNSRSVLNKITKEFIPQIGKMKAIVSDNGPCFNSNLWNITLNNLNIKIYHSTPYHPQSSIVERTNKEVNKICRIYCHKKHTQWPDILLFAEHVLNNSVQDTIEAIPYEVMFGKRSDNFLNKLIKFPIEHKFDHLNKIRLVRENLISKAEKRNKKHNEKLNPIKYTIGDKVLVKNHVLSNALDKKIKKYFLLYEGPYVITDIKRENAYALTRVDNNEFFGIRNVRELKRFIE
uniref:RNA-directed DNA polymerase n=1 Tax=Cuerna arida TaxID=1464854 RepID=A0A1B6FNG5_9HEMI